VRLDSLSRAHLILLAVAGSRPASERHRRGGTLISFPALMHTGMEARIANATNTVAIWPGTVSSTWAYRAFISAERHRARALAVPSLLGGLGGSILLLHTSERSFRAVVPWLIVFACLLLALQGRSRWWRPPGPRRHVSLWVAQSLISVYGGYFGAGIGILMLAAMAILIPGNLQAANGLKVLFAMLINGISAAYFILAGAVRYEEALVMMVAALAGGWAGAHLAQRLPSGLMRALVIGYGLVVAGKLFLEP
jgi:uncharacterized membrane protein YfcA